ncbi:MAG TPA: site-2 protease family protein [Fimbriimonas sp.]|nr:site-2 protease family protein [Fimbriimonas sp.]
MSIARERPSPGQNRSLSAIQVASVAGIPIRVHFTLILFLLWIARDVGSFALVATIFACVVLHEIGHALVGLHYKVHTRDITIYPIGGIATLQNRPKPREELWIALAGPAVNFTIFGLLYLGLALSGHPGVAWRVDLLQRSYIESVMVGNLVLGLFNLIPAFPMDGGRVLRALLALHISETRATQIASAVGQVLAMAFLVAGFLSANVIWMLVALFVFLGAEQEARASLTRSFLAGHVARDVMQTDFRTLSHGETLEGASKLLLSGSQHDFPVDTGEQVPGILTRSDLVNGLAVIGPSGYVAEVMQRAPRTVEPNLPLEDAVDLFSENDTSPILVMDHGQMVGLLTSENLSEFVMLETARSRTHRS